MQSYIIYRKDMALRLSLTILICILLMLFSIYYLKSNSLAFIFCIGVILPLLFIKPIMKKFTRRINIKLQENFFSVAIASRTDYPSSIKSPKIAGNKLSAQIFFDCARCKLSALRFLTIEFQ